MCTIVLTMYPVSTGMGAITGLQTITLTVELITLCLSTFIITQKPKPTK